MSKFALPDFRHEEAFDLEIIWSGWRESHSLESEDIGFTDRPVYFSGLHPEKNGLGSPKTPQFQKSRLSHATAKQNFGEITIILFCNNIVSHFESEVKFAV